MLSWWGAGSEGGRGHVIVERPMVQCVPCPSRPPKALETNLPQVVATAVTLYLLGTQEGNPLLPSLDP